MNALPAPPKTGAKTFYADGELWAAAQKLVEKNPKLKSVSKMIERLLIAEIRVKGKPFGIRIPAHLLTK